MSFIQAVGLSWRHASRAVPAIDRLDVRIERGERVLLLGPSGGGKSTLLAAFAGVLDSAERGEWVGELRVDGRDARARTTPVGLLRQDPETSVVLGRVGDEVRFGAENLGISPAETNTRATAALELVGLGGDEQRATSELSGGQKQRLTLAALLTMRPTLWLLDEPTAQLDPLGAQLVREAVLNMLRPDDTLVLVEHQAADWWPHITRVIALNAQGEIAVDTSPKQALGAQRAALEALGVWLPNPLIESCPAPTATSSVLMNPERLIVGRRSEISTFDTPIIAGNTLVLRGANGSGKSTLALTLGGLIAPLGGKVNADLDWAPVASRRNRKLILSEPITWRSPELSSRIASVFQQPDLQFVRHRVVDEIRLGACDAQTADGLLERLGLAALAEMHPNSLSGGEKRRLSVATALASSANVIIADEPTFGQDAHSWSVLTAELAAAATQGRALVLPSHDTHLPARLHARVIEVRASSSAGVE